MQTSFVGLRRRPTFVAALSVLAFVVNGCGEFERALTPEQPATSESEVAPQQGKFLDEPTDTDSAVARGGEADEDAGHAESGGGHAESSVQASSNAQSTQLPLRLSTGVALAQTLPTGTGMSFSVDYQFVAGRPNQSNQYVWVIEGREGKSLQQAVQLGNSGNIPLIVRGLRPEAGPFSSYVVEVTPDGSRRKISRSIDMR